MSKSSVRTVFSEISFSVDRPRDMQDIKDVKPQVDHPLFVLQKKFR